MIRYYDDIDRLHGELESRGLRARVVRTGGSYRKDVDAGPVTVEAVSEPDGALRPEEDWL